MTNKTKAGLAFLVIGVLSFVVSSLIFISMKADVSAVISGLPAADPSLVLLNKAKAKIGYASSLMNMTSVIILGVGYAYLKSGITERKD